MPETTNPLTRDKSLTEAQRSAVHELLRVSPVADELGLRFAKAGRELHLVGGSVRDALLGRLGDDLDFTTDARPEETLRIIDRWAESVWTTGQEFGTIGLARRGLRIEVTTFRADAYDRVSRNPIVRYGDSLADDLRRRDFAVNAMAVSVPGHEFTDPHGGLSACCAPRAGRRSPSPTTRCACCAPPGSSASWASRWRPRCGPR
jgi:poly(A) polymerase